MPRELLARPMLRRFELRDRGSELGAEIREALPLLHALRDVLACPRNASWISLQLVPNAVTPAMPVTATLFIGHSPPFTAIILARDVCRVR